MDAITIAITKIDGVKKITFNGSTGTIFQMSRDTFLANKDAPIISRVGAYVIYADHFDKAKYGNDIYIGQGDDVTSRLQSQSKGKLFWNRVLIFTSEWMNIACTFNIERAFIAAAKLANRYKVDNRNDGQTKRLGPEDESRLEEYIPAAIKVIELANIDIFTFNEDGCFFHRRNGLVGTVKIISFHLKQVVVLKGSEFPNFCISDHDLAAKNVSDLAQMSDRKWTFKEDAVVTIDEDRYSPSLLSMRINHFKSNCGVDLRDTFKRVEPA
jgi:hypothetical protein